MSRKTTTVVSFAIALVLGGVFWWHADRVAVIEQIRHTDMVWFSFAVGVLFIYQFFRAWRLKVLLETSSSLFALFRTTCIQGACNNLLPSNLGDVALVVFLKRFHAVNFSAGGVNVVLTRIMDLFVFAVLFLGILFFDQQKLPLALLLVMTIVGALSVAGLAALAMTPFFEGISARIFPELHARFFKIVFGVLHETRQKIISTNTCVFLLLLAFLHWGTMYFYYLFVILSIGSSLSPKEVLYLYILMFPLDLLPVKGVANLGTFQAGWVLAMAAIGHDAHQAMSFGFSLHALLLASVMVPACIALASFLLPSLRQAPCALKL